MRSILRLGRRPVDADARSRRVAILHARAGSAARFDAGLTGPDGTVRKSYDALRTQLAGYQR
jgi:hypothetical protein